MTLGELADRLDLWRKTLGFTPDVEACYAAAIAAIRELDAMRECSRVTTTLDAADFAKLCATTNAALARVKELNP